MEETYGYPVFFECRSLGEEEIKKIEKYFSIRRRSGGGDCGSLRKVKNTIYSVAFKNQKDQQAVLKKSKHVVKLAEGHLEIIVRSSLEPQASSPSTSTASHNSAAAAQEACNKLVQAETEQQWMLQEELLDMVFKSVQESVHLERLTVDVDQPGQRDTRNETKRIILLGKTGSGKSNLANTIFGEELFNTNDSPNSGTSECQAETRSVNGRNITLIDTPGFFDVERSEEEINPEAVNCITECAPGPHAFLIVLKVEKFTEHEQAVISKISEDFSEDALKYAVIVFTHGDQLSEGVGIDEFVSQNKNLSDLVKKCGGRCHVVDNKYWKNKQQNEYRSNLFQVEELLKTIDKMVIENNGGYYTNEMFQEVETEIQEEEENIRQSSGNMPIEEIRQQAKSIFSLKLRIKLAGFTTGAVIGALLGVPLMIVFVISALRKVILKKLKSKVLEVVVDEATTEAASKAATEAASKAATGIGVTKFALVATATVAAAGGVVGGVIGYSAAEGAETPSEAVDMAADAVFHVGKTVLKQCGLDVDSMPPSK